MPRSPSREPHSGCCPRGCPLPTPQAGTRPDKSIPNGSLPHAGPCAGAGLIAVNRSDIKAWPSELASRDRPVPTGKAPSQVLNRGWMDGRIDGWMDEERREKGRRGGQMMDGWVDPWGKTYGKLRKAHAQRRAATVTAEAATPHAARSPGGQGRGGEPTTTTPPVTAVGLLAPPCRCAD